MQIARVGVEEGHLLLDGPHDAGVAVADEGDVVVGVEIGPARLVVEILHPAAHDLERLAVGDAEVAAEELPAGGQGLRLGRLRGGEAVGGDAQDQVGVRARGRSRASAGPGAATPGEVPVETEKVEDDLDVDVRPPVAVRGRRADRGEGLAGPDGLSGLEAGDRVRIEMAVEREELRAGRRLVAEDDQRAVVLGRVVARRRCGPCRRAARARRFPAGR